MLVEIRDRVLYNNKTKEEIGFIMFTDKQGLPSRGHIVYDENSRADNLKSLEDLVEKNSFNKFPVSDYDYCRRKLLKNRGCVYAHIKSISSKESEQYVKHFIGNFDKLNDIEKRVIEELLYTFESFNIEIKWDKKIIEIKRIHFEITVFLENNSVSFTKGDHYILDRVLKYFDGCYENISVLPNRNLINIFFHSLDHMLLNLSKISDLV